MSDDSSPKETTVTDSRGHHISQTVAAELQTAVLRLRPGAVGARVWERILTEQERQDLGGGFEACRKELGTVRMYMEARGACLEQAVIDIAERLNLMDAGTATWLRRELDLSDATPVSAKDRPTWNPSAGELRLDGRLIRRIRVLRRPSNIQQIVDRFEAAGWPRRIKSPLKLGQQQLHQTLRYLNRSLKKIRFRAQEGAQAIIWERI
jgi:hypothetical protein